MIAPAHHSAPRAFWSSVDGALVLNLDSRPDRWATFQAAAQHIVPAEKLQRLPAIQGTDVPGFGRRPWFRGRPRDRRWAGRAGCLLSHRQALLRARAANWKTVLILEDDVAFAPDFARLADALMAVSPEYDWEVCYLGFTDPWWPRRKETELDAEHGLYRVQGCNTAHAYLVREPAREWILARLPDAPQVWPWLARHRAIDRWYQRQLGLVFPVTCVSPGIVNQTDDFSDIVGRTTDYHAQPQLRRAVTSTSGMWGYYAGHALRRLTIRLGLVADGFRGLGKRLAGF